MKAAITGQKRANAITVNFYNPDQDLAHFDIFPQCVFIDFLRSLVSFSKILFCANTTISMPANSSWCNRKLSLINLFIRLRCTAECKFFFDIARPSLAMFKELALASKRKLLSTERCAESKTFWYSGALVSLRVLVNPVARGDTAVFTLTIFSCPLRALPL